MTYHTMLLSQYSRLFRDETGGSYLNHLGVVSSKTNICGNENEIRNFQKVRDTVAGTIFEKQYMRNKAYSMSVVKSSLGAVYDANTVVRYCEDNHMVSYKCFSLRLWSMLAIEESRMCGIPGPSLNLALIVDTDFFELCTYAHSCVRTYIFSILLLHFPEEWMILFAGSPSFHDLNRCPYFHSHGENVIAGIKRNVPTCSVECKDGCIDCVKRYLRIRDIEFLCEEFNDVKKNNPYAYSGTPHCRALSLHREIQTYYRSWSVEQIFELRMEKYREKSPKDLFSSYAFVRSGQRTLSKFEPNFETASGEYYHVSRLAGALSEYLRYRSRPKELKWSVDRREEESLQRFIGLLSRIKLTPLERLSVSFDTEKIFQEEEAVHIPDDSDDLFFSSSISVESQEATILENKRIVSDEKSKNFYMGTDVSDLRDTRLLVSKDRCSADVGLYKKNLPYIDTSAPYNTPYRFVVNALNETGDVSVCEKVALAQTPATAVQSYFSGCSHEEYGPCNCLPYPYLASTNVRVVRNESHGGLLVANRPDGVGAKPYNYDLILNAVVQVLSKGMPIGMAVRIDGVFVYPAHIRRLCELDGFIAKTPSNAVVARNMSMKQVGCFSPTDVAVAIAGIADGDFYVPMSVSTYDLPKGILFEDFILVFNKKCNDSDFLVYAYYDVKVMRIDENTMLCDRTLCAYQSGAVLLSRHGYACGMYVGETRDEQNDACTLAFMRLNGVGKAGVFVPFSRKMVTGTIPMISTSVSASEVVMKVAR